MSKFIIGNDRSQIPLFASSMDQAIAQDNQIRIIDLFVDSLKLADFGFDFTFVENGLITPRIYSNFLFTVTSIACVLLGFWRKNVCGISNSCGS